MRWRPEAFMKPRHALAAYISRTTTLECGIVARMISTYATFALYCLCTGGHQSLNMLRDGKMTK